MEKNDHNLIDNNIPEGIGIIEQIRILQELRHKPTQKDMENTLRMPYLKPNTNIIYYGIELAENLQAHLNL